MPTMLEPQGACDEIDRVRWRGTSPHFMIAQIGPTTFGMPKEAVRLVAATIVTPLHEIPDQIIEFARGKLHTQAA